MWKVDRIWFVKSPKWPVSLTHLEPLKNPLGSFFFQGHWAADLSKQEEKFHKRLNNIRSYQDVRTAAPSYFLRSVLIRSHLPSPVGYMGHTAGPPSQNVQAGYMMSWYSAVCSVRANAGYQKRFRGMKKPPVMILTLLKERTGRAGLIQFGTWG